MVVGFPNGHIQPSRRNRGIFCTVHRLLLSRPLGGLNDTLCGLSRTLEAAERFQRLIILDTKFSGLMGDFDDFFSFRQGDPKNRIALESIDFSRTSEASVHPWEGFSGVSISEFLNRDRYLEYLKAGSEVLLKPQLNADRAEQLIVFHSRGGGNKSHELVRQLSVVDSIQREITTKISALPDNYVGVHIRHTDYRTEVVPFLTALRRRVAGRPIYLATDNNHVVEIACELFGESQVFHSPPTFRLLPGEMRHNYFNFETDRDRRAATILSLVDLFALARSDSLVYPPIYVNKKKNRVKDSGFSTLARFLHENPTERDTFFGVAPKTTKRHPRTPNLTVRTVSLKMRVVVLASSAPKIIAKALRGITRKLRTPPESRRYGGSPDSEPASRDQKD